MQGQAFWGRQAGQVLGFEDDVLCGGQGIFAKSCFNHRLAQINADKTGNNFPQG
jgi:hypothetical protein